MPSMRARKGRAIVIGVELDPAAADHDERAESKAGLSIHGAKARVVGNINPR